MWVYDLNLYTVAYFDQRVVARACSTGAGLPWRGAAPLFALGGGARRGLAHPPVARGHLPVAVAARHLRLFRVMAVLATALRGSGGRLDPQPRRRCAMALLTLAAIVLLPSRPRARLGQGQARQAFVRASLRLSHRMAALHRDARRVGPDAAPLGERIVKAFADMLDAPGGILLTPEDHGGVRARRRLELAGQRPARRQPRAARPSRPSGQRSPTTGRIVDFEARARRLGRRARRPARHPRRLARRAARVGRHSADPPGAAGRPRRPRRPRLSTARSTGRITTCCAPPGARRPRRSPKRMASRRWSTRSGSRTSTAASPSSSTTSRTSSASCQPRRAQCRAPRRQSRIPRRHGRDAEMLGRQDERPAACASRPRASARAVTPRARSSFALCSTPPSPRSATATTCSCSGDAGDWVVADGAALEQAIGHLLHNAIDASPADAPVIVRVDRDLTQLSIAIIDQGRGMDADFVRNRLFQPFASTKDGGFGVGAFEARVAGRRHERPPHRRQPPRPGQPLHHLTSPLGPKRIAA